MTEERTISHTTDGVHSILLLGASFDTGNLGVGALAESSIKILRRTYPGAAITLFGDGYEPREVNVAVGQEHLAVRCVPVRFCRNIGLPYHFLWFMLWGVLAKLTPGRRAKRWLLGRNAYCRALRDADLAAEITGGDSFSDLYGMRQFVLGFLRRWLVLLYGKRLIMLPQTYGPFRRRLSKVMARYVLRRAERVYCRDHEGVEFVRALVGPRYGDKVRFAPDVAFVLDPRAPDVLRIVPDDGLFSSGRVIVGLNVSGLLYHDKDGGRSFGLAVDYRRLVRRVAESFLENEQCVLLLMPHVFPPCGFEYESDPLACQSLYDDLAPRYAGRVFLAKGPYDQAEAKHLIGRCDFFVGSRMHACIAALSQGIPAVGLAYSKKFAGVFESVGVGDLVVDLRQGGTEAVSKAMCDAFTQRHTWRQQLATALPRIRETVLHAMGVPTSRDLSEMSRGAAELFDPVGQEHWDVSGERWTT